MRGGKKRVKKAVGMGSKKKKMTQAERLAMLRKKKKK